MPYVITTSRPCGAQFRRCDDPDHADVTRHAVATLEEAREFCVQQCPEEMWPNVAVRLATEIGGIPGRVELPDGTVVEVQEVSWAFLMSGDDIQLGDYDGAISRFNLTGKAP